MTLKQEIELKNFFFKKLDENIMIQFLGRDSEVKENISCNVMAKNQHLSIDVSEDDVWKKAFFYVDYIFTEDNNLAWQVQYNPNLIIFDDLFSVLNQIIQNKTPEKLEGNILPFPWHCNYAQLINNENVK